MTAVVEIKECNVCADKDIFRLQTNHVRLYHRVFPIRW
jgi:hypothetical protein